MEFAQKIPFRRHLARSRRGFEDHAVPLALQELNRPLADSIGVAAS